MIRFQKTDFCLLDWLALQPLSLHALVKQAATLERPMWQGIECNLWPMFSERQSPKPIPLQGTESCQKTLCELESLETWLQLQPTPCLQPRKTLKHAWNPDAWKLRGFKPINVRVFCNATVDNWYRLIYLSLCFRASIFYSWCLFPNFFILVGLYIFFIPVFLFCYGFRKESICSCWTFRLLLEVALKFSATGWMCVSLPPKPCIEALDPMWCY